MVLMRMRPFWILALLPLVSSAGDESKRVPHSESFCWSWSTI
jgi:hypothetical protein